MPRPREDELVVSGLRLVGVTEGGVETNLRVPELGVMFDIGMCPPKALGFDRLLISHGHADHLGGIHYYLSQRGMRKQKVPTIAAPKALAPQLEQMLELWSAVEGFDYRYDLRPAGPGDRVELGRGLTAIAVPTVHRVPSLAWVIERRVNKLLPAFQGKSNQEIRAAKERGETITESTDVPLLCVSGDTTIDAFLASPLMRQVKVLVHECTSWSDTRDVEDTRAYGHTHVDEIIEHAERFEGEALVLVHRSLRHTKAFAEQVVRERFPASVRDKVFVFGN